MEDWGKLLGDSAAVTAMLDRLLHHGYLLQCGPAAGEPKPGTAEKPNDKSKSNKDAGQKQPGNVRVP